MPADVPPGEPAAPPAVPGYTLQELLGRGASGEVWRAVPRGGGEPVAVKVLVAGDPERQAREAALLGGLDHPHLVRLLEVVHQPRRGGAPRVALILELLAGGSLSALLARRGRLTPGEVVTAIAPVAAALAHAHELGIVHADVTPANLLFTAEGRPVLTDLGVARLLGGTAVTEVTPAYADPAVARGGPPVPASDVFGLAATAFHALTGIAPWNAATPADALDVAGGGHVPDLEELAPGAPEELLAVVRRGLAADPHERGTAAAFARDLRRSCAAEPVVLTGPPPGTRAGRPDARTELTHVVPGRRPRPVPVGAAPGRGRHGRARTRRPVPSAALVRGLLGTAGVLVALAVTAWAGNRWAQGAGADAGGPPVTVAAAAATTTAPQPPPSPSGEEPRPPGPGGTSTSPAGPPETATPIDPRAWRAVVEELYSRRAEAFAGTPGQFAGVYTAGSPLRIADERHARDLAAAGEVLSGFAPVVLDLSVIRASPEGAELHVTDRWPDYRVVPADPTEGRQQRTVPGRGNAEVRLVLARTPEGWRIEEAERVG